MMTIDPSCPLTARRTFRALSSLGLVLGLASGLAACTPDLGGDDAGEDGPPVVVVDNGDGSSTITVDSRDEESWVYLDLESLMDVSPVSADDSQDWDLGFLRFNVKGNSGSSGSADVGVLLVDGVPFEGLDVAPADGYAVDNVMGGPEDMEPEPGYAFDLWYDYDMDAHTLAARDVVYAVRSASGNYFKIQMLDYYNDAGTAGYVKFKVATLTAP